MPSPQRHQINLIILLTAVGLGALLYLSGLSVTLRLGNADIQGILLVPSMPIPLYVTMALVMLAGVALTLLASAMQHRRRPTEPRKQRTSEALRGPWQVLVSLIVSGTTLFLVLWWLIRYGTQIRQWLEKWRHGLMEAPGRLADGTQSLLRQVDSPVAGYALFVTVLVVYGGLALLGLWVLFTERDAVVALQEPDPPDTRRVRRAMTAGLHELQQHRNPRQAIIACYARLEHLLEDYGVPAHRHLTPQEYMGTALQGLDLPIDAFAGLIELFEKARYSLHPLDDAARETAIIHLETLKSHLEWGTAFATRA
jgi:hypothetical protein